MLKEEGADDDEIETEMSTIKNQVIYVYLLTGRNQDASERMSSGIERSKWVFANKVQCDVLTKC